MTKTKLLVLGVISMLLMTSSTAHIETVVTYKIHNSGNKLYVSASMEKSYATILVMSKGEDITSKNRGVQLNTIIKKNTNLIINDTTYHLKFESGTVKKKSIVLQYYIENIPENISSLKMNSDVIVGLDEEAIVNAFVSIHKERRCDLRFDKQKKTNTIKFK